MNFLAHLYLAEPGGTAPPGVLVGSLLPDLMRCRGADLPADIARGVRLHQRVDRFTDTHPAFLSSRSLLRPRHGHFAGVLVDMLYDHLLACRWTEHHDQPLDQFVDQVHDALTAHEQLLPQPTAQVARRMRRGRWLMMYHRPADLREVLAMMSARFTRRFDRPVDLTTAVDTLDAVRDALEADFDRFFPAVVRHVANP